jgi:hypothetical protein
MTTAPADTSSRIVAKSRISSGSGDGTTRRQPRSPRDSQFSPAAIRSRASASLSQRPIGFVGRSHAGSSGLTSTRVITVLTSRSMPRPRNSASIAVTIRNPSVACVCATHQSSGTGGTTSRARSFLTSRLPTCGPLPCVSTT